MTEYHYQDTWKLLQPALQQLVKRTVAARTALNAIAAALEIVVAHPGGQP
jgi:hypothetical protein